MTEQNPIRVYLVDDHEVVRRGVAALLETDPTIEVVGESGSATVALREILELRPDVAILDAHLADGTGVDICREMRSVDPTIKGLILTTYDDPDAISAAILAGASGYVGTAQQAFITAAVAEDVPAELTGARIEVVKGGVVHG